MRGLDYFTLAAGLSRIAAVQYDEEAEFPRQEERNITPIPATEEPEDEVLHEEDLGRDEWDGIPKSGLEPYERCGGISSAE